MRGYFISSRIRRLSRLRVRAEDVSVKTLEADELERRRKRKDA
jgi:hypothetical protein